MNNSTIIKALRTEKGYTQQQLSDSAGIKLATLQKLESGANSILRAQVETIYKLSVGLGVPMDTIVKMALET